MRVDRPHGVHLFGDEAPGREPVDLPPQRQAPGFFVVLILRSSKFVRSINDESNRSTNFVLPALINLGRNK